MKIVIRNGHVLDPASGRDGIYDLLIEDGIISRVEKVAAAEADALAMLSEETLPEETGFRLVCDAGIHRSACAFS